MLLIVRPLCVAFVLRNKLQNTKLIRRVKGAGLALFQPPGSRRSIFWENLANTALIAGLTEGGAHL